MESIPLSYANFLILWILQTPSHGYEIMKEVSLKTNNTITIGPATMYRSLSFYLENKYIELVSETDNKKKYRLTATGHQLLEKQLDFFNLIHNIIEEGRI